MEILSETPLPVDLRPPQAASPIDDDDLLSEILLRLPPLPSSLPRASLVCTRWRRLATDPDFLRRFRAHHWKPLGVFLTSSRSGHDDISFSFVSDPRGSIPPERFSVPARRDECTWTFHGCRHGRVLLINRFGHHDYGHGHGLHQVMVWNPVAGKHHIIGVPHFSSRFGNVQGAVVCASGDNGPFKVALVWDGGRDAHVCVYSSETGVWGDVVSTAVQSESGFIVGYRNVMIGNSLYWILFGFGSQLHILEFDLGSQNLAVIKVPLPWDVYLNHRGLYLATLAKGGGLSLIIMSANLKAQLWERTPDSDGAARWMLGGIIELDKLLSLISWRFPEYRTVIGLDGDYNLIFVSTYRGVFMVRLETMQFEKIFETTHDGTSTIHPFTNLYPPGTGLINCGLGS